MSKEFWTVVLVGSCIGALIWTICYFLLPWVFWAAGFLVVVGLLLFLACQFWPSLCSNLPITFQEENDE